MLPQNTVVLLVQAHRSFDHAASAVGVIHKGNIKVLDMTEAVTTARLKTVGVPP